MQFGIRTLTLALPLAMLVACGPDVPELDARIADAPRTDYPGLGSISGLIVNETALADTDAIDAAAAGATLEQRFAILRRRAAWLRSLQL